MLGCYEQTVQPHLQPHQHFSSKFESTHSASCSRTEVMGLQHTPLWMQCVWVCECVLVGQPATDAATILRPSTSGDDYD